MRLLNYNARMRLQLIPSILLSLASLPVVAAEYRDAIVADRPAIYWRFESHDGDVDQAILIDGKAIETGPGRRGVSGLAVAFGRSQIAGRVEGRLTAEQDKTVEQILNGTFSLEFWFLDEAAVPDNKTNYSFFYKADVQHFSRNSMWFYRARQDGHYHFRIHGSEGKSAGLTVKNPAGEKAAGDGKWHHIVVVVSRYETKATMRAVLDGRPVAEKAFSPKITIDNQGPLVVGNGMHPNSPWQGLIDEFAVYPRALSEQEIRRHHDAGLFAMTRPTKTLSPLAAREDYFELKIRPLLIEKCVDCHSGEADSESVLSVNSRESLLSGGDFGPAIVPGRAEDSVLMHAAKRIHKVLRMPPEKADALSREEVAALARWIDDGAVWPQGAGESLAPASPRNSGTEQRELTLDPVENWAFLPRQSADPPSVEDPHWSRSGIDQFLEHARRKAGLTADPPRDD